MMKLCFTIGREIPTMSVSWNASVPTMLLGTWPDRITIGMESMYAVAIPVMALVAPAGSHQHDTGLAGGAGVAVGHMGSRLFVAHQDVGHVVLLEERVVDMQEGTTRVPVDVLNAFVAQRADDHFSAR